MLTLSAYISNIYLHTFNMLLNNIYLCLHETYNNDKTMISSSTTFI